MTDEWRSTLRWPFHLPARLAADGSELAALSGDNGRRQVLELDTVPEHVRRAVLAAEDGDFYEHSGTNPRAVLRAVGSTTLGHTQGGSTITQQLAKLNYTGSQRSLFHKVAVWVGYDPARRMTDVHRRSVTGGSFPAAIFGDLMRTGLAATRVRSLPVAPPDALHLRPTGEVIATTATSTTTTTTRPPSTTTTTTQPASSTTTR